MDLYRKKIEMLYNHVFELGHFDYLNGGSINLSIKHNMLHEHSEFTQIHEMNHMLLSRITEMGFLLNIFEFERVLSHTVNPEHSNYISKYAKVIFNAMHYVQEVYANSMELLLASTDVNTDLVDYIYNTKTEEYKDYCNYFTSLIKNSSYDFDTKRMIINDICFDAFSIDYKSESFLEAFKSPEKLKYYFNVVANPKLKMEASSRNIDSNIQYGSIKSKNDLVDFIKCLGSRSIFKYANEYLTEISSDNNIEKIISNYSKLGYKDINNQFEDSVLKEIRVFELTKLKVNKYDSKLNYEKDSCIIIKNCINLKNVDENFYMIGKKTKDESEDIEYIGDEIDVNELKSVVNKSKFILIPAQEYDFSNFLPKYFDIDDAVSVIIFDNYFDFKNILTAGYINDYYIGDLYPNDFNNYFTCMFIRPRVKQKLIVVFPTIKKIANLLLAEIEKGNEVIYSVDQAFLKLFNCFSNELDMMTSMNSILSYVIGTKGLPVNLKDPCSMLTHGFNVSLTNRIFNFNNMEYFEYKFSLPTLNTAAEPFYAIMNFDGMHNIGEFLSAKHMITFYKSREEALHDIKNEDILKAKVVGIDKLYWSILRKYILSSKIKVAINISIKTYREISIEMLDYIINRYKSN